MWGPPDMLAGVGAPAALAIVERQGEALRQRYTARRDNQADINRLKDAAERITDVESLLKDRRTLQIVLEAFQLESEINKVPTLRRVLTEDPNDSSSYANRLADPRWKALATAFAGRTPVSLPAATLAATSAEEVARLSLSQFAGLDFLQVQALTVEQIDALRPDQIGAISPDAISGMDAADVASLNRDQVAALAPAQIRALLMWQVSALEPEDINALTKEQIRAFTPQQIGALTPEQVKAFSTDQIAAFTGRQAGAFDQAQLAALSDSQRNLLKFAPFVPDTTPETVQRSPLADPDLLNRIIDGAMTNRFEKAMGEDNPGMREALYFKRMASQVTTIPQLMSDRALTEVVRGALGLPTSFASLEFEQQKALLTQRLDLSRLQDPREVARMAARYVATREDAGSTSSNPAVMLLGGGGASLETLAAQGISLSL